MLYKKNSAGALDRRLFERPTSEYRGAPFWAWNCKVTEDIVDRQTAILKEMGFGGLEEVAPLYAPDSPSGNAQGGKADPLHWMRFEKMGIRVEVVLAKGSSVTGTILSGAAAREFIEGHDAKRKDKRACLIVRRADDDYDIVPWAEVVDVRKSEG